MNAVSPTNKEFLEALRKPGELAGCIPEGAVQWICHYSKNNRQWGGYAYSVEKSAEFPQENTFFSVSMYLPIAGKVSRKKANFVAMLCVVLDDVGTKANIPPLEPSWKIETSPGNCQWGYILNVPITDAKYARRLVDTIAAAGYSDPGAKSPETRYMRMPIGSNGKPEHVAKNGGRPVPHKVLSWHPDRWFEPEDIIKELNLTGFSEEAKVQQKSQNASIESSNLYNERDDDAELIRKILNGEDYHDASLILTARYHSRGMQNKDIIEALKGIMQANADRSTRWKERYNDIPRLVLGAVKKFGKIEEEAEITFVDFASLSHTSPPARKWAVKDWLPLGTVTALYGPGGIGKSLLAQQLAIAIANGEEWLGIETIKGNVLGLFCEDDNDELLRRGADIFSNSMLESNSAGNGLYLDARAGKSNTLATFENNRQIEPTSLLLKIREECEKLKPILIILDNIAQMFAGQENDRYEVTSFCNLLTGIARDYECAVLLLGHPAKQTDSQYSGSTAWEAAVRTRIFLKRNEDNTLTMYKAKANYSVLDGIRIEYQNGAFVALTSTDYTAKALELAKPIIIEALDLFNSRQESCSNLCTARNYIVKKIINEGLGDNVSAILLKRALDALIDEQELIPNSTLPWLNTSRHKVQGLALRPLA